MDRKKYTIKDIAQLAGVSKGTVDRVLHKRGKVSKGAEQSVRLVLEQIDYQPNPIARNLKHNKLYRICVLLPNPKEDLYWIPAHDGLLEAAKEYKSFGVTVKPYFYHPYDQVSFRQACEKAVESSPDALLAATTIAIESLDIFKHCKEKNILLAFFNNHVRAKQDRIFIGQDLHQSGRIAAQLLSKLVKRNAILAVVHFDKEQHMQLKEDGFRSYFLEQHISDTIISKSFLTGSDTDVSAEINSFLVENDEISGVFVTNSKAHIFARHCKKDIVLIGYDLLEPNIELLKNGKIDFLIHQKPKRQAYLGVGFLAEHFLFGKPISNEYLLPIDIISSENVSYHLDV